MDAQGEVWRREDGEGLDEDLSDCFFAREMGVELISRRLIC